MLTNSIILAITRHDTNVCDLQASSLGPSQIVYMTLNIISSVVLLLGAYQSC